MKLVVDTDVYCKLSASELFVKAIHLLGADITECGRLAALPYMLRHGRLRSVYGPVVCDELISVVNIMPIVDCSDSIWLETLTSVQSIDPGEAQIFAMSAEAGLLVMTGDKRALHALVTISELVEPLSGRIVVFEAVLIALCNWLGPENVRQHIQPVYALDKVVQVCFSSGVSDPRDGLNSYYNDLATELQPLVLWDPRLGKTHDPCPF